MGLPSADPTYVLHENHGSLVEVPLPVLLYAILIGRRTCELVLKNQALEKRIFFEDGTPVGCTSNLVQETLGRYLVEKGVLSEARAQELLAISARRGRKLGEVLVSAKVLDETQLAKHLQNNLGRRILDSFLWVNAQYQLAGVATLPETALKMQPLQLIYVGVCTMLPIEVVRVFFSHPAHQRFALVQSPLREWAELKLGAKDEKLVSVLASRPTLEQLCAQSGASEDEVTRRVYAWSVLGLVDLAERVPEISAAPTAAPTAGPPQGEAVPVVVAPAPAPPEVFDAANELSRRSPARWLGGAVLLLACGLAVAFFIGRERIETQEPVAQPPRSTPAVVVEPLPAAEPARQQPPLPPPPALPPTTGLGAAPPRTLALSASGIVLAPPTSSGHEGPGSSAFSRGLQQLTRHKADEASGSFTKAIARAPANAEYHYALGLALFELGRESEALTAANDTLGLEPAHAMASLLAGYLELRAGRSANARAHFEAYLAGEAPEYRAEVQSIVSGLSAPGR